jgi:hypothetical protein
VPRQGGRAGGTSVGISVYVRDPDHNLLEFISHDPGDVAARRGMPARRADRKKTRRLLE